MFSQHPAKYALLNFTDRKFEYWIQLIKNRKTKTCFCILFTSLSHTKKAWACLGLSSSRCCCGMETYCTTQCTCIIWSQMVAMKIELFWQDVRGVAQNAAFKTDSTILCNLKMLTGLGKLDDWYQICDLALLALLAFSLRY